MDKEKLKEIFREEASEIIEKLDIEIVDLEEAPDNKDLMNELFRGVHTLKGSANSFGFKRLGEFVHSFEDVLDYYRNSDDVPGSNEIDIFLDSVDTIKDVFEFEIDGSEGLPEKYEGTLQAIKTLLNKDEPTPATVETPSVEEPVTQTPEPGTSDLSAEFGNDMPAPAGESSETLSEEIKDRISAKMKADEALFKISLNLDDDVYLRGQDHFTFLKLLQNEGTIHETQWDMSKVPPLNELDSQKSYLGEVNIYFTSSKEKPDIEELFEYLEDYEYKIELFDSLPETPEEQAKPTPVTPVETKSEPIAPAEPVPTPPQAEPVPTPTAKAATPSSKPAKGSGETKQEVVKSEEKRSFVKIDTTKLDELFDSVGELVIAQNFLAENGEIKVIQNEYVNKTIETLSKITRLIQNRVMSLRMVPIRDTFEKMKRVIRDASRKVNKEVRLQISGEDTEIDKTMVDALSDPLIHIIRNSVDHGIEATADDRLNAGKSKEGNVFLRAYHKGGNIVIEISDDGRGINKEKVLSKAIERGLANPEDEYNDQQIYSFIMQAGFSTADKISDISGRGVGLDVVRTSIENLRGKVEIDSTPGEGSKFCIYLPLTLAIIDGMLVKSAGETYIIPTLSIVESFRPTKEIVHIAQGKGEFVNLREELLPIVRLNQVLELDDKKPDPWESTLVCAENEKGRFAILIDELIGRQQVVIKTLGKTLSHLNEVSGGAVLGNGDIALILNVEGLY